LTAEGARTRHRAAALSALALLLLAAVSMYLFVWPDLPPLPPRADAIINLGTPVMDDTTALALAHEHRAPILAEVAIPEEVGTQLCLPPVPGVTIVCFYPDPNTTRGEARFIGQMARQHQWTSVIIVTTPDHAWRARLRVSRCFPGAIYVATLHMPAWRWLIAIPYQWAATLKALLIERGC